MIPAARLWLAGTLAVSLLSLGACDWFTPEPEPPAEQATADPEAVFAPVEFVDLPGWASDDLSGVSQALGRSCTRVLKLPTDRSIGVGALAGSAADWQEPCAAVLALGANPAPQLLRQTLERHYTPLAVSDMSDPDPLASSEGLFTGYFEAELKGSRTRDETFASPLYAKPRDLITVNLGQFDPELSGRSVVGQVTDGQIVPYPQRGDIEAGALDDQGLELLWIDDPVDVFLLHVQGSGRVILPDGEVVRVGFAAHNGHGYQSIGRKLINDGALESHEASWDGIRGWVEANPNKATELFAFNPRFIFFRVLDGEGPIGAEGVALTPERSLAIDTRYIPLGAPIWLDTTRPGVNGAPLQRLMVAQDKGNAIKGVVRGDFFWGYGDAALAEAGRMKSRGQYFILVPNALAERMRAAS